MVMVELKGLHIVKAKGKTYYYAWRGGPRIHGEPGTPKFQAAYNEAVANHRAPDRNRFRILVTLYKNSPEYKKLATTTRYNWARWLDRITDYFGELRIEQFNRADKIRPTIRKWRARYAETPRAADYGMQVLSRVLSHAVDPLGKIASNPCEGIKQLYDGSRSEIIWTDSDITQLKGTCSQEIAWAVDLAAHTGLRVSDLIALSWSHVHDDAIIIATGKSKQRREAIIPRYDALNDVLADIPQHSTAVLTTSKKMPWTRDGLGSSFNKAKIKAGMKERDLHFHDLRGTAATKFYVAGLPLRVIAEIMAWEEDAVSKIIRRYVGRDAAMRAVIRQINEAKKPVEKSDGYEIIGTASVQSVEAMNAGRGVYFIRGDVSKRIKIGTAQNPVGRIMELSIGSSEKLNLMAVIKGGREEEGYLHKWFEPFRVKGEWFEANDILDALIEVLAEDATIDWKLWLAEKNAKNIVRFER